MQQIVYILPCVYPCLRRPIARPTCARRTQPFDPRGEPIMLKPNLLALAVASVLAGSAAAYAADAQPARPDTANAADQATGDQAGASKATDESTVNLAEIKVTGVRAAIEEAISIKLNSNQIVEAISAEDIGKLPDNSIAESLARLPGITAQR